MLLFAQTTETVFRLARIQENRDWFLPLLVAALLVVYFVRRYRIDAAELKTWQRAVLGFLRLAAIAGLLFYFLHPQWEHIVGNSRVAVLLDTSASMGRRDLVPSHDEKPIDEEEPEAGSESGSATGPSRLDGVVDWLKRSDLTAKLLEKHDVAVYSFDKTAKRIKLEQREQLDKSEPDANSEQSSQPADFDFSTLKPEGEETSLGDALLEVLQRERDQPLAGVILVSDGRLNSGQTVDAPLEMAHRLHIPVYSVGVGMTSQPLNVRVGSIDVPDRAFPGDPFTIRVPIEYLGGPGGEGEDAQSLSVPVELWLGEKDSSTEAKVGEKTLSFQKPGTIEAEFEVRVPEPGKRKLSVKILPPKDDHFAEDNAQTAEVEVVDRKDRILLFASAPSRDYQFLCSQIYRDKSMSVDVYLPWAKPGISQNANKILDKFPSTRAEMAEYDTLIAFDANWKDLSTEQINVLEFWIARQGGGLILVAGAVNQADTITGWVTDPGMEKIRALYPVDFLAKQSAIDHQYHGNPQAYPLKWTRAGEEADFLKPSDNAAEARAFWNDFPGFFGYFAVKGVKPTATLLASSGSPDTMGRSESGAMFVEQFYGAGRVLYIGSGELWRLRRVSEKAFEQIATRIVRYVSQGRLQRESDRGTLATDKKRYSIGSIAQLRITANDAQLKPLETPTLPIDILSPNGTLRTVESTLDPNVPGSYSAHLPLVEEGTWTVQWTIPESDQKIVKTLQVRMSDLERENPSRNEPLLREIATKSGAVYYPSPALAAPMTVESALYGDMDLFRTVKDDSLKPVTELLRVRSQRAVVDSKAEENLMQKLLIAICSILLAEWTLRRLMKLA